MCFIPNHTKGSVFGGLILLAVQAGFLAGCSQPAASGSTPGNAHIQAEYDQMGKLTRLNYDRNKNNRTDTVAYMDGTRVVRIEIDSDENGLIDRWEYYANQKLEKVGLSAANDGIADTWVYHDPKGEIRKIEISANRDGKVNRTEFYQNGVVVTAEEDSDADGQLDKWESYRNGTLTTVAFDTRGRGRPDRQILYGNAGAVDRIEVDPEGDGTFVVLSESR